LHDPALVIVVAGLWRWAHVVVASALGAAWLAVG